MPARSRTQPEQFLVRSVVSLESDRLNSELSAFLDCYIQINYAFICAIGRCFEIRLGSAVYSM